MVCRRLALVVASYAIDKPLPVSSTSARDYYWLAGSTHVRLERAESTLFNNETPLPERRVRRRDPTNASPGENKRELDLGLTRFCLEQILFAPFRHELKHGEHTRQDKPLK